MNAGLSIPSSNYPVVRSSDPEFVRDRLFATYAASSFDIAPDRKAEFGVTANHLQMTGIGLSYCRYDSDVSLGFSEATFVRQLFSIQGAARCSSAKLFEEIASGSFSEVVPAFTPLRLDFTPGYRQFVLRIELSALQRCLNALLGEQVSGVIEFGRMNTHNPAMMSLRRAVFQFASDFNERGAYFSDLAAAEVERMIIMNFLMCHRHSYTHRLLIEPLPVTLTAVKIVEEFIEANWNKPIDIQAMCNIANVSARSLFRQFKKDRGYTPAQFAKQVRLTRAREMLERSEETESVVGVALKCGFQNPGHFASDYRIAFGELPSDTLKKSAKARPSIRRS